MAFKTVVAFDDTCLFVRVFKADSILWEEQHPFSAYSKTSDNWVKWIDEATTALKNLMAKNPYPKAPILGILPNFPLFYTQTTAPTVAKKHQHSVTQTHLRQTLIHPEDYHIFFETVCTSPSIQTIEVCCVQKAFLEAFLKSCSVKNLYFDSLTCAKAFEGKSQTSQKILSCLPKPFNALPPIRRSRSSIVLQFACAALLFSLIGYFLKTHNQALTKQITQLKEWSAQKHANLALYQAQLAETQALERQLTELAHAQNPFSWTAFLSHLENTFCNQEGLWLHTLEGTLPHLVLCGYRLKIPKNAPVNWEYLLETLCQNAWVETLENFAIEAKEEILQQFTIHVKTYDSDR